MAEKTFDPERRLFLKTLAAGAIDLALPRKSEAQEQSDTENFSIGDFGKNLDELHGRVANGFAEQLGDYLREQKNLIVTKIIIDMSDKDENGQYWLGFMASLRAAEPGEKPDMHIGHQGTIGEDRKFVRKETFKKAVLKKEPRGRGWLQAMQEDLGPARPLIASTHNNKLLIEEVFVVTKDK